MQDLARVQRPDGGWGRFHSLDSSAHQKIPTTEFAVRRALALGLEPEDPILHKAASHISAILAGDQPFPDPPEVNERWPLGVRLFLSSTLARLQPDHLLLETERRLWLAILRETFRSGVYDPQAETQAHQELTGVDASHSYLVLASRYHLDLLGSKPELITQKLAAAWLAWLWARPQGLGYLGVPLNQPPPHKAGPYERWLASMELLARNCPGWSRLAGPAIDWLWGQQGMNGLWDFGPRSKSSAFLPLTDSWRRAQNRAIDWSARILILLNQFKLDRQGVEAFQ